MTLPGLFIEYLVSGALALIWLMPLLPNDVSTLQAWHAPIVAAFLYALGMSIDLLAFAITRPIKWRLRNSIASRMNIRHFSSAGSASARLAFLQKASPAIAAEIAARSSRDRIARCTFVNAVLFSLIGMSRWPTPYLAVLCISTLGMWLFFEASSHAYELRAAQELDYVPKFARQDDA